MNSILLPQVPKSYSRKRSSSLRIKNAKLSIPFKYCKSTKKKSYIGGGCFGKIYAMKNINDNQEYAVKHINIKNFKRKMTLIKAADVSRQQAIDYILKESQNLAMLNHPNIVRYYTTIKLKNIIYISLEFLKGGNLKQIILSKKLSQKTHIIFEIVVQICQGLNYLHSKGFLHRDIKADNILLESVDLESPIIKLGDFGLSCLLQNKNHYQQDKNTNGTGHMFYRSPEAIKGMPYGKGDDNWAVGIVALEMLSNYILSDCITGQIFAQYHNRDTYIETIIEDNCNHSDLKEIIKGLLNVDPEKRMTSLDVINYKKRTTFKNNGHSSIKLPTISLTYKRPYSA